MLPPSPSLERASTAEFYSARSSTTPALPWTNSSPPFALLVVGLLVHLPIYQRPDARPNSGANCRIITKLFHSNALMTNTLGLYRFLDMAVLRFAQPQLQSYFCKGRSFS